MIINWYGGGCYKIEAPGFNLVSDPETSSRGSRLKADLILETRLLLPLRIEEMISDRKIAGPGEYEVGPVKIWGVEVFPAPKKEETEAIQTIYAVLFDGIRFCFLGNIDDDLNEAALDALGNIDILFVPVNKKAQTYIKIIEPKIIIPGFGDPEKLSLDLGQKALPQEKLVIKRKDIEEETGMRLVILKA